MVIGVPREGHRHESRVGLTPSAVAELVGRGHTVVVETEAGRAAHFQDSDYRSAGARIVYSRDEAYKRAGMICRVGQVAADELELIVPGTIICSFHSLAVAHRGIVERLMELGATLVGYEVIEDGAGELPVLEPLSEMAGQMAVHLAAELLQNDGGGRGILLGNIPGVPPPTVLILGGGSVGSVAASQALATGAHVMVVDSNLARLRRLHRQLGGRAVSFLPTQERLERFTAIADVVIGAVLIPGARAPFLVSEAMVEGMKAGSVIIDISIDQGGCVETSRPTTLADPTFTRHGVVHYCVPNMTANVSRTASRALAAACVPYVMELAGRGLDAALRSDAGLAAGVYLYRGRMVNPRVGESLGIPSEELGEILAEAAGEGERG